MPFWGDLDFLGLNMYYPLAGPGETPRADSPRMRELKAKLAAMSRRHIESSPEAARIELITGDAREIVPRLDGPFDLVFIDAWKADYRQYYEAVVPKLAERGLIVCDNVLWGGGVADPENADENTTAMRAFNDHVQEDPRVTNALLTVGDGLMLIWRNSA